MQDFLALYVIILRKNCKKLRFERLQRVEFPENGGNFHVYILNFVKCPFFCYWILEMSEKELNLHVFVCLFFILFFFFHEYTIILPEISKIRNWLSKYELSLRLIVLNMWFFFLRIHCYFSDFRRNSRLIVKI